MNRTQMLQALKYLDSLLHENLTLLVGGGASLILGHNYPLSTSDIDATPLASKIDLSEIDHLVKQTAKSLGIDYQWINYYFSSYTYVLPIDYQIRLVTVFQGNHLCVKSLGAEDIIIMKCFAGREKDIGHIKSLLKKKNVNIKLINRHLELCIEKRYPKAIDAADFFDDICDSLGI